MKALFHISYKLSDNPFVIIDFTYLKSFKVSLFIASIPLKGRSVPFYCKTLFIEDIHKLIWKSINHFIMTSVLDILRMAPGDIIFLADRQFGTKMLMITELISYSGSGRI
jgi:hypothetical protein